MTEVLTRSPDVIETEVQFEQFGQVKPEELLFPKLDGVLLPLAMENADVVAPCQWMGGVEVSLSVALNNYYQQMTEENADEVIMDVYEFLAGRLTSEIATEQEDERVLEPVLTTMPQVESASRGEHVNDITETPIDTIPAPTDLEANTAAPVAANPETQKTTVDQPIRREAISSSKQSSVMLEPQVDDILQTSQRADTDERIDATQEALQPIPAQDVDTADTTLTSVHPLILELDRDYVIDHQPLVAPTIAPEETLPTVTNSELPPPTPVDQETETADIVQDELTAEIQVTEIAPSIETLSDEDEVLPLHEESVQYEQTSKGESPKEPDSPVAESASLAVFHESAPATDVIDSVITRLDALLASMSGSAEIDETKQPEIAEQLTEAVADISANLEPSEDDAEIAASEESIQEQLVTLYTELLGDSPLRNREAFIHLLVALTMETQDARESAIQKHHSATVRKRISGLKVVIKKLRRAWSHIMTIGRLALRSHTATETLYPPIFFYAYEGRS